MAFSHPYGARNFARPEHYAGVSYEDPTDVQSQERSRKDRATRDEMKAKTEEADIKWLMSGEKGRRIVWRLLERAGVFRLSFSTNSMQMAFNDGAKNEGLRMLALIHAACPEKYVLMLEESNAK